MKAYVEYLDYTAVSNKLYNPCGDRSTFILDGRNSLETMIQDAIDNNGFHRPQYPHFRVMRGNFRKACEVYTTAKHEDYSDLIGD